jgi:DNA-binding phage protein
MPNTYAKDGRLLTVDFDDTVRDQLQRSPKFRRAYLREALSCMLDDDLETGRSLLRKYINATIGFIALGEAVGRDSKTLMRMFGPRGNPTIRNYFEIVSYLQKLEGTSLQVVERRAA